LVLAGTEAVARYGEILDSEQLGHAFLLEHRR
jgi:hypothetical protein